MSFFFCEWKKLELHKIAYVVCIDGIMPSKSEINHFKITDKCGSFRNRHSEVLEALMRYIRPPPVVDTDVEHDRYLVIPPCPKTMQNATARP